MVFETTVAPIFSVVNSTRRGMGNHNVHALLPPEGKVEFPDKHAHLCFMVLIDTAIVPSRSGQTQQFEFSVPGCGKAEVGAANRRALTVSQVVVAEDIVERRINPLADQGEVFRRQVATGKDQFHPVIQVRIKFIPQCRDFDIGNGKDFHWSGPGLSDPFESKAHPLKLV